MAIFGGIIEAFDGSGDTIIVIPATSAAAYEPYYLLSQISTVDGSGSGLDADLLDGYHASHFGTAQQVTNLQNTDVSLQNQINGLFAVGSRLVFKENFTGNGVSTSAVLTGALQNAAYSVGAWSAASVLTALQVDITNWEGAAIYDSVIPIYRDRIKVTSVDSFGNVTLNFPPLNGQQYSIWYFYQLQASDVLSYYYREEYVSEMESGAVQMAADVDTNTTAWGNIVLRTTDNTVQKAFDRLDSYVGAISGGSGFTPLEGTGIDITPVGADYSFAVTDYIGKTEVASISGDLQSQIDDRVPYTGATSDVNLGNNKLLTDAIQLDLTPTASPASTKGQITWNDTEGTANIGLGDVTLQVGLESLNLVYNEEGSTIYNGQLVYIYNHNHDGNPAVKLARADIEETSLVFGMATQDIGISGTGFVTSRGKVRDLDTSAYMEGAVLYLSDSVWGGWTAETSGFALSSHKNKIGYVGPSDVSSGYVFIDIDNEAVNSTLSRTEEIIASGLSMSTGVYDYSGMTIATSASFTVPPLKGWVVENTGADATAPRMTNVTFAGGTYPVTNILTDINTYVLISKTGVISQQVTLPTPTQRRDNIYLGKVAHSNKSSINIINNTADYSVSPFSALRDVFTPIAIMNAGITPYPDGANLSFNKTAGSLYGLGINWTADNKNPNKVTFTGSTPASFNLFTQTAPELFGTTLIQPGFYDVAGVKTAVPGNSSRSTNVRIYQFTTGVVGVQYGQTVYTSLANAVAATQTESYIPYPGFAGNAILIGILSVRRTATDLSDPAYAIFTPVSILGEATGGTAGLSTTTLQQAYDNSTSPEILTNSTLDGVTFRRGSASDSDKVIHVQSGNSVDVFTVNGLGEVTVASISGNADNLVAHDATGKLLDSGVLITDLATTSTVANISGGLNTRLNSLEEIIEDTGEPTGFVNRTDSTLYYDPTTTGFAISGSYDVYVDGIKYSKTGDAATITPAYGTTFIKYDAAGAFNVSTTAWAIDDKNAQAAYVFFNDGATDSFMSEERHGCTMDAPTHAWMHFTQGAKYKSGFAIGDYLPLNSDTVGNNKYSIAAGDFYDEDILNSVTALADNGPYNIFYRTGASGNWTWSKTEAYPYFINANSIRYNQFTGATWQLTNITTNNRWVNYYVFATNALTSGFGIVIVPGQTIYTSLALAQGESVANLSLGTLPFAEIVPLYRVTHQFASGYANANGRARIVAVANLTSVSFASAVATSSTNHNSLSGLQGGVAGEYFHLTNDQANDFIGEAEVAAISGNLQQQIDAIVQEGTTVTSADGTINVVNVGLNYDLSVDDYISKTEVASISGDLEAQIDAIVIPDVSEFITEAEVASISGDLQTQINTKQNIITLVAGSNVTITESPADTWTISTSGGTGTGFTPLEGTGIEITPVGADYSFAASAQVLRRTMFLRGQVMASVVTGAQSINVASPISGTITGWKIITDLPTVATLDVWKLSEANPTDTDSIVALENPSISGATYASSTSVSTWDKDVSIGDVFELNVDSNSAAKVITLEIDITLD
jgi:hypothetical protein